MSIFEDKEWTKEEIIELFETRTNLSNVHQMSYHTCNGEIQHKGTWFMYFELEQLLEIYDK